MTTKKSYNTLNYQPSNSIGYIFCKIKIAHKTKATSSLVHTKICEQISPFSACVNPASKNRANHYNVHINKIDSLKIKNNLA